MNLKKEIIKVNSEKLYASMGDGCYTFTYLQKASNLDSSDLCIALLTLIRDNRVQQMNKGKIFYSKIVF